MCDVNMCFPYENALSKKDSTFHLITASQIITMGYESVFDDLQKQRSKHLCSQIMISC